MQKHLSLIQDVRGCMTRFDPLTPQIVAAQSEDGLTYEEMQTVLAECGMDIRKVVFDGTRGFQNAFYADFEQGHYCWIPFCRANLKDIVSTMDQNFQSPGFGQTRRNHEWAPSHADLGFRAAVQADRAGEGILSLEQHPYPFGLCQWHVEAGGPGICFFPCAEDRASGAG